MEKLKRDVQDLYKENQRLAKEGENSKDMIKKLKDENRALRNAQMNSAENIEKERIKLLEELNEMMKHNASDEELKPLLQKIIPYCSRINELGHDVLARYLTGDSIMYLISAGFFTSEKDFIQVEKPGKQDSVAILAQKIMCEIKDLTAEQKTLIIRSVQEFYQLLQGISIDRTKLNQELSKIFEGIQSTEKNRENLLQLVTALDALKNNLKMESDLTLQCMHKIHSTLTPKQLAIFFFTCGICA